MVRVYLKSGESVLVDGDRAGWASHCLLDGTGGFFPSWITSLDVIKGEGETGRVVASFVDATGWAEDWYTRKEETKGEGE